MGFLFILLQIVSSSLIAFSQSGSLNESYRSGLSHFQNNQFDAAESEFKVSLKEEPQNPFILYNLGLTEFKLHRTGLALGLWRAALFNDPSFARARHAIQVAQDSLKVKALPHEISNWETIRENVLVSVSLNALLGLTVFFLLSGGFLILKYFGKKRTEQKDGAQPPLPLLSIIFCVAFFVTGGLSLFKVIDNHIPRATVILEKVEARSGPNEDQTSLFELFEGLEVIVRQSVEESGHKPWVQVTYPGGMTGWVPSESIIQHSGLKW